MTMETTSKAPHAKSGPFKDLGQDNVQASERDRLTTPRNVEPSSSPLESTVLRERRRLERESQLAQERQRAEAEFETRRRSSSRSPTHAVGKAPAPIYTSTITRQSPATGRLTGGTASPAGSASPGASPSRTGLHAAMAAKAEAAKEKAEAAKDKDFGGASPSASLSGKFLASQASAGAAPASASGLEASSNFGSPFGVSLRAVSPSSSVSREASSIVSTLENVETAVETGRRARAMSRSKRDAELKELQERLYKEAEEKRQARRAASQEPNQDTSLASLQAVPATRQTDARASADGSSQTQAEAAANRDGTAAVDPPNAASQIVGANQGLTLGSQQENLTSGAPQLESNAEERAADSRLFSTKSEEIQSEANTRNESHATPFGFPPNELEELEHPTAGRVSPAKGRRVPSRQSSITQETFDSVTKPQQQEAAPEPDKIQANDREIEEPIAHSNQKEGEAFEKENQGRRKSETRESDNEFAVRTSASKIDERYSKDERNEEAEQKGRQAAEPPSVSPLFSLKSIQTAFHVSEQQQPKSPTESSFGQLRKELQAQLPSALPSPGASLSSGTPGLGGGQFKTTLGSLSRSRSRSGSSTGSRPTVTVTTLYRVVGSHKFYVVTAPAVDTAFLARSDSYILHVPSRQTASPTATNPTPNSERGILYVWHGPDVPKMKRVKAMDFANRVRDMDCAGRAIIEEVEGSAVAQAYWKAFGVTSKEEIAYAVQDLPKVGADLAKVELFEYPFLDEPTHTGRIPPTKLYSDRCHVIVGYVELDNQVSKYAYLWVGKNAYVDGGANQTARQVLVQLGVLPAIVNEGVEPAAFKEHLLEYGQGGTLPRSNSFMRELKMPEKVVHSWKSAAQPVQIISDAEFQGPVTRTILATDERIDVDKAGWGIFYSGEVYLLEIAGGLVKWIGMDAIDAPVSLVIANELDPGHKLRNYVVHQLREPPSFAGLFQRVVYRAGRMSTSPSRSVSTAPQLYAANGHFLEEIHANASHVWVSGESHFALRKNDELFVTDSSLQATLPAALQPSDGRGARLVTHEELASHLPGDLNKTPAIHKPAAERIQGWIIHPSQQIKGLRRISWRDCHEDIACVIDVDQKYLLVWIGGLVKDQDFLNTVIELAKTYAPSIGSDSIYVLKSNAPSPGYILSLLLGWSAMQFNTQPTCEKLPTLVAVQSQITTSYPIERLRRRDIMGLDQSHLENYLSDSEFQEYIKMSREAFKGLPQWKQQSIKKSCGLF